MSSRPPRRRFRAAVSLSALLLCGLGAATVQEAAPPSGADLQVRVAVVPALARQRGWFRDFQCAASRASELLHTAIGRQLHLRDRVTWSSLSDSDELHDLRSQLIDSIDHGGADLVVGLVPARADSGGGSRIIEDGLAAYSQGYLVMRVGTPLCEAGKLLAHEIAHIFGGIHRAGQGNLMDPLEPGTQVDELNAALFDLHRDRHVREQAPPLHGETLRMMWRLSGADIETAGTWLRVGVVAANMGKYEPAITHYEHALAIDRELRVAWVNLGHARLQRERFAAAEQAYVEALARDDNDGTVHNNLAVVYMSMGQPRRAQASMNRALELGYDVPKSLRDAIRHAVGIP
jgi:tetratricopeptide (TPR) repeat protein